MVRLSAGGNADRQITARQALADGVAQVIRITPSLISRASPSNSHEKPVLGAWFMRNNRALSCNDCAIGRNSRPRRASGALKLPKLPQRHIFLPPAVRRRFRVILSCDKTRPTLPPRNATACRRVNANVQSKVPDRTHQAVYRRHSVRLGFLARAKIELPKIGKPARQDFKIERGTRLSTATC